LVAPRADTAEGAANGFGTGVIGATESHRCQRHGRRRVCATQFFEVFSTAPPAGRVVLFSPRPTGKIKVCWAPPGCS